MRRAILVAVVLFCFVRGASAVWVDGNKQWGACQYTTAGNPNKVGKALCMAYIFGVLDALNDTSVCPLGRYGRSADRYCYALAPR